jgi:peptidoglycan/LPS O-acetylase OafA/YrhL
MAMRLVPTAFTVLLATMVASALVLPEGRWPQTIGEIIAAALFLENWRLAADAVDYAALNNVASVVQHYWSLSIQVQFFLLWPLLVAVIALACRHDLARLRGRLTVAALAVFVVSLVLSVRLTEANQPLAYFHTLTRLWEFAAGALLALCADRVRLRPGVRVAMGWVGVAGLLVCGLVLPVSVFPGYAALWPTGCAAMILLAGATGSRRGADRLLAARPARYLGRLSYALYLWHWPILVLYLVASGTESVGLAAGLGVVAVAVALAALTHHVVESPLARAQLTDLRRARVCTAGLLLILVGAGGWQLETSRRAAAVPHGEDSHPGARALLTGQPPDAPLLPPPVTVYEDWVRIEHWDCTPLAGFPMDSCALPTGPEPPLRRIVVVGDSHAQQLTGALVPVAERHGWHITVIARGACPFSTVSEVDPDDEDCRAWLSAVGEEIIDLNPDVVVTLATRNVRAGLAEQTPAGFVEQWARLHDAGIRVVALRDNPRFDISMPDCIQQQGRHNPACGISRDAVYSPEPPWTQRDDVPPSVAFVDIASAVCTADFCPAEIGNVMVYLDDNHLTATYAASMAELLEPELIAAIG